jgi:hypothetical protein
MIQVAYAKIICHPVKSFDGSMGKMCVSDNKEEFESIQTVGSVSKKDNNNADKNLP